MFPKRRLTVLVIVLVVLAVAVALSYLWLNKEVVSQVEVRNPDGDAGTALVVYHPGKSDFQEKVTYAFAESLVSNGWRVEIATASSQAPTDLSGYDLLVLGGPTYWFTPSRPIPIAIWDYASPGKVREAFEMGRADAERFVGPVEDLLSGG